MLLLLALALQTPVHVAPPMPEEHVHPGPTLKTCPVAGVIPKGLEGWRTMTPVAAAMTPATIRIGRGARATLLPAADVAYPLAPARPGAAGTSGGVFAFDVTRPARYRVALGAGAWIDVVQDGKALESKAHSHGPECSPVKKMVDFDLTRGRYLLEVSGSPTPTLGVMVVKIG